MALHGAIAALDAVKSVSDMKEDFYRAMVDLLIRDVQPLLDQVPFLIAENNVLQGKVRHLTEEVTTRDTLIVKLDAEMRSQRAKREPKA